MKFKKLMILSVLSIIILMLFTACSSDKDKKFSELPKVDQESYIWVMTQSAVKEKLKSPDSAEFPMQSKANITNQGGNVYKVESYVEAKNSFGTKLKNNFVVVLNIDELYNEQHKGYGYKAQCTIKE